MPDIRLSDYLSADRIILDLESRTKSDVLRELTHFAVEKGLAPPTAPILEGLEAREKLISTGVGDGVAIPHTRCEGPEEIFLILARSKRGIDFDSLDGGLTHLFMTIVGPVESDQEQLKLLSRTARFLKRREFREHVLAAASAEEIVGLLLEEERLLTTP